MRSSRPNELDSGELNRAEHTAAQKPRGPRKFFRETLEAAVSALVIALLLKTFLVEAYSIPTGSMQPTLLGLETREGRSFKDRVLVDRLAYLHGDPRRFDVAVFRFPLDRGRSFVKRVWGLPGDAIRIANGDVQRRAEDGSWHALRRPDKVMDEMWLEVERQLEEGSSQLAAGAGPLSLRYPPPATRRVSPTHVPDLGHPPGVRDNSRDGYPSGLQDQLQETGGRHVVGDLRLEITLAAGAPHGGLRVVIGERSVARTQICEARIPGHKSRDSSGASPATLRVTDDALGSQSPVELQRAGTIDWGLEHTLAVETLDDRFRVLVDGESLGDLPLVALDPVDSWIELHIEGAARYSRLKISRDVHYVLGRAAVDSWEVPAGHYFVLGDNTQASLDSRAWRLSGFEITSGPRRGETIFGQLLPGENPSTSFAGPLAQTEGPERYFRDQWGERHRLQPGWAIPIAPREAPFIPRDHMLGRAFAVVWPISRELGLQRPKWVHGGAAPGL